jgi:predicted AlkP superfamily pyrophosphatase or phosphodiesterase
VDYDALAIGFGGAATPEELAVGKWAAVEIDPGLRGDQGPAVSYVKLLAMAPDLARVRLYVGGAYRTRAYPETYLLDLLRAGMFWPGPPDDGYLEEDWAGRPGIDVATWLEQSDRFAAFFGAAMVRLAAADDWDLALAYVPSIDEAGHELYLVSPRQAGWSRERMAALERARRAVWRTADGLLDRLYASGAMEDTAVVVVSDHGMAPVHSTFGTNVLLRRRGLLATDGEGRIVSDGTTAWAVSGSAGAHIYLRPGLPEDERQRLLAELAALFTGFTTASGERPIARAVTRREAVALGLDHPNSGDLILFGAPGWVLASGLDRDEAAWPTGEGGYGAHGFLAGLPEMDAIYLALGPGIGRGRIGKLHATEVAGRVAALLGINLEGAASAGTD